MGSYYGDLNNHAGRICTELSPEQISKSCAPLGLDIEGRWVLPDGQVIPDLTKPYRIVGASGIGKVITATVTPGWTVSAWQWFRRLPNGVLNAIPGATNAAYMQVDLDVVPGTTIYPVGSGLGAVGLGNVYRNPVGLVVE
jgi:hypothetical protein